MASINMYKKMGKSSQTSKGGGYKPEVFFAPKNTFASIKLPAANPTTLAATKTIALADTFLTDEGYISLTSKLHSVMSKSAPIGDEGVQQLQHTFEFELIGNSPELLALTEQLLNDECIWLIKDANCLEASAYERFGDECVQPSVKVEYDSKTTKEGVKIHKVTGTITEHKYFYTAAVTEKPAA